jgi:2-(1,2-epoxy-1,2-dihydrophenyl)acetyl-CoA isomerase
MLGDSIDAEEAARLGMCNRLVPAKDLECESRKLVERLGNGPTLAYGQLRRLIRASFDSTFSEQLDAEADGFRESAATLDFREGVDAFLGKRKPTFQGR